MKIITGLLFLLVNFSIFAAPKYCQGKYLYDHSHTIMYQFSLPSECQKALEESFLNHGRFCDRERLISDRGGQIDHFKFRSDCTQALQDLNTSFWGLYCKNEELRQLYRGWVSYFDFKSDCKKALQETNRYRGHFCNGSVLMNHRGERLQDFGLSSSCKKALSTYER